MDREQDIRFVFENGVLRPEDAVNLPEGARGIAHIRATSIPGRPEDRNAWLKAQEGALAKAWDNDDDAVYDAL